MLSFIEQTYVAVSKIFKQKYLGGMYIADVEKMNEALFSRGISAVFLSYVVLVLNVKRGLGMFHTLRAKSCVSASDPKQGAAFHYILANFTLKGIVFLLHGIEDDELKMLMDPTSDYKEATLYLESASSKFDVVKENLACFNDFEGRLKFDNTGSLATHFAPEKKKEGDTKKSKKETGNDEDSDNEEEEEEEEEGGTEADNEDKNERSDDEEGSAEEDNEEEDDDKQASEEEGDDEEGSDEAREVENADTSVGAEQFSKKRRR